MKRKWCSVLAAGTAVLAVGGAESASAARTMTSSEQRAAERVIRAYDRAHPGTMLFRGEARRETIALRSTVARDWALVVLPGYTSSTSSHWIALRRAAGRWKVRSTETWSNGHGMARWFCRQGRTMTIIGLDLMGRSWCRSSRTERWLTRAMTAVELRSVRDGVEWRAVPAEDGEDLGERAQQRPPELHEAWMMQDSACNWDGKVTGVVSRADPRWAKVTLRCGDSLGAYLVARSGRTGPFTRTTAYYNALRPAEICDGGGRLLPKQRVRIDLDVCAG